jgi:hypothetical protein
VQAAAILAGMPVVTSGHNHQRETWQMVTYEKKIPII